MLKENLGSIFVTRNIIRSRTDIYYGFRDGTGLHAHIVLIDGELEHWRGISGLDKNGFVIGVEIFYTSEFPSLLNKEIDKEFLENLKEAYIEYKDFRNIWFVVLILQSKNKQIVQPLPPLRKSEYVSPLVQYSRTKED